MARVMKPICPLVGHFLFWSPFGRVGDLMAGRPAYPGPLALECPKWLLFSGTQKNPKCSFFQVPKVWNLLFLKITGF